MSRMLIFRKPGQPTVFRDPGLLEPLTVTLPYTISRESRQQKRQPCHKELVDCLHGNGWKWIHEGKHHVFSVT